MSALSIQPTYPIFTDIDGQPLEAGYVWIGQANLDPQVNPINVYWDAALSIPATQPVRTLGGYPSRNGTPARLYVNSDYSIRVMNRNGSTVYSAPTATERYNEVVITGIDSADVTFIQPYGTSVERSVQSKERDVVSVFDFMTAAEVADVRAGTMALDVTTAIQNAVTSGAQSIYFPNGKYKVSNTIQIPTRTKIYGDYGSYNQYNRAENAGAVLFAAANSFGGQAAVLQAGNLSELGNIEIHNMVVDITLANSTAIGIRKETCNHFVMVNVYVSASFGTTTQIAYFNGNGTHGYFENINLMGGKYSVYMDNTPGRECHDSVYNKVWMYPAMIAGAACLYFPVNGGNAITTWIMPYMETDSSGLVTGIYTSNLAAPEMTMILPMWDGTFLWLWNAQYPARSRLIGSNLSTFDPSQFNGPFGRCTIVGREGNQFVEKLYLIDVGGDTQFGVDSSGFNFGRISEGAAKISKIQGGTKTEVIGTVNSGSTFSDTISVSGCTVGAPVSVGIDWTGTGSYILTATVISDSVVRYWLTNNSGSPVDYGTRVLKAVVINGTIT